MPKYTRTLLLAGVPVICTFSFAQSIEICQQYLAPYHKDAPRVKVTDYERNLFAETYPDEPWNYDNEMKNIISLVSDELLAYNRMVFHCVSFIWNEKAWLITAPSGTGKSTQCRNLKQLYGDEIEVISGDDPILHMQDDGIIMVHPSPWNGKEKYHGDRSAPLAGIVLLEQQKTNRIYPISPKEIAVPFYTDSHTFFRTEEQIHQLIGLLERLITSVPIWKFENTGTLASSEMLMECLKTHERSRLHEIQDP